MASNSLFWLVPFDKFEVLVGITPIDWFIASGFNNIVPNSGNKKPYELELVTKPPSDI